MVCIEYFDVFDNLLIFIKFLNKFDFIVIIGFIVRVYKLIGDENEWLWVWSWVKR